MNATLTIKSWYLFLMIHQGHHYQNLQKKKFFRDESEFDDKIIVPIADDPPRPPLPEPTEKEIF
jgi:hypothetical protein